MFFDLLLDTVPDGLTAPKGEPVFTYNGLRYQYMKSPSGFTCYYCLTHDVFYKDLPRIG